MDRFVVGFAFGENKDTILLIKKLRPEWQKGLLNGIGGKIEKGESSLDAMRRECKEETGLTLNWIRRGIMQGKHSVREGYTADDGRRFQVYIFYAYSNDIFNFKQIEDEPLAIYEPSKIPHMEVVTNLEFLISYGIYTDGSTYMSLTY